MKKLFAAAFAAVFWVISPVWAAPVITTVSLPGGSTPTTGGVTATIFGSGFGLLTDAAVLNIGGAEATITARTQTEIQFTLPEYTGGNRSPDAFLTVDGVSANPFSINYDAPSISALAGATSIAGGAITIIGQNFGTDIGSLIVRVGGQTAALTLADHGEIQAILPVYAGGGTSVPVVVEGDGLASNSFNLTYTSTPTIISVDGASGPETGGNTFTIFGTEFDPTTGLVVSVDGNLATVVSQSLTEIVAIAPPGTGQDVLITVGSTTFQTQSTGDFFYNYETQLAVSEPATALILGLAVAGLGIARSRRR